VTRDPGALKPPLLELEPRRCPVCGSDDESQVVESNVDPSRIGGHSFASRKEPEYMHYRLVQCPVCRLLYASPVPPADVVATAYRDALYDSGDEARFAASTYARALQRLRGRLPPRGGALDIGAGDGAFVAELVAAGFDDAVGVEPSSAPIASASPEVKARLRHGVFRAADFEPGGYRLITAFQVLEHVADPLGVYCDAHALLGDGGALFVIAHDRRAVVNRVMGRRSPIYDIEHLQLFSRRSLAELFARAGFERVEMHSFLNRYPLRYWLRLFPFPQGVKRGLLNRVGSSRVGGLSVSLPVGNIAAIGFKGPSGRNR
jgi:SAM-dependent methyltransferase